MNEKRHTLDRKTDRGIQLLRIIACLAVFICHFSQRMHIDEWSMNLYNFTQLGRYGVELFFVISGYLICFSLSKKQSILQFYKKRAVRILPLYFFCVLYFFITETFIFQDIPPDPYGLGWLRYIFCLNGIVPSDEYFWSNIGITWTIPVFMSFYLCAPLLKKICNTVLSSSVVLLISIGIAVIINHRLSGWLSAFIYFPCFIIGIIVFHVKKNSKQFWMILVFQIFVFIVKWCKWDGVIYKITKDGDLYLVSLVFATLIVLSDQMKVKRISIKKALDVLDEHSYTLYLVHGIVFCGIIDKFQFNKWIIALIAILLTIILTITIHKFIEKPIQNKLLTFQFRTKKKNK